MNHIAQITHNWTEHVFNWDHHTFETYWEFSKHLNSTREKIAFLLPFWVVHWDDHICDMPIHVFHEWDSQEPYMQESMKKPEIISDVISVPSELEFWDIIRSGKELIASWEVAQIVLSRIFQWRFYDFQPEHRAYVYAQLLNITGSYMTSSFQTNQWTHLFASPERQIELKDWILRKNPLAWTIQKDEDPSYFVLNQKEQRELDMILEEELKQILHLCPQWQVSWPFIRHCGNLLHTEFQIKWRVVEWLTISQILKASFHAPTLCGSPLQRAIDHLVRLENDSRWAYGWCHGYINKVWDLYAGINIRGAEILPDGTFNVRAWAGITQDSDAQWEMDETENKAHTILNIFNGKALSNTPPLHTDKIARIEKRLQGMREERLNSEYFTEGASNANTLKWRSILIINHEDNFSRNLQFLIKRQWGTVDAISHTENEDYSDYDLVILSGWPGDINDPHDPKMTWLIKRIWQIQETWTPLLGICLGHQAICKTLWYDITKQEEPSQGVQKVISVYGEKSRVGMFNSFSPKALSADEQSMSHHVCETHKWRIMRILSESDNMQWVQFHPEAVMTQDPGLLIRLIWETIAWGVLNRD